MCTLLPLLLVLNSNLPARPVRHAVGAATHRSAEHRRADLRWTSERESEGGSLRRRLICGDHLEAVPSLGYRLSQLAVTTFSAHLPQRLGAVGGSPVSLEPILNGSSVGVTVESALR